MGAAEFSGLWDQRRLLLLAAEAHPCPLFGPGRGLRLACVLDKRMQHTHAHTENTYIM